MIYSQVFCHIADILKSFLGDETIVEGKCQNLQIVLPLKKNQGISAILSSCSDWLAPFLQEGDQPSLSIKIHEPNPKRIEL